MKRILAVLLLVGCSKGTPAVRLIPYAQATDVAAQNCQAVTETLIITPDGGNCPGTSLAGRNSVLLCSDPRNGTAYIKVRADQTDGGKATMGDTIGMILGAGDCAGYILRADQPVRCVTDTLDAGLQVLECR